MKTEIWDNKRILKLRSGYLIDTIVQCDKNFTRGKRLGKKFFIQEMVHLPSSAFAQGAQSAFAKGEGDNLMKKKVFHFKTKLSL